MRKLIASLTMPETYERIAALEVLDVVDRQGEDGRGKWDGHNEAAVEMVRLEQAMCVGVATSDSSLLGGVAQVPEGPADGVRACRRWQGGACVG